MGTPESDRSVNFKIDEIARINENCDSSFHEPPQVGRLRPETGLDEGFRLMVPEKQRS